MPTASLGQVWVRRDTERDRRGAILRIELDLDRWMTIFADGSVNLWSLSHDPLARSFGVSWERVS
jgi:hypothetical protein